MRYVVALTLILYCLAIDQSDASNFSLGLVGDYSRYSMSSASSSETNSVYQGPGVGLEVRLRILGGDTFDSELSSKGFDFYFLYSGNWMDNIGDSTEESLFMVTYGGGVDARFNNFFVGVNYLFSRGVLDSTTNLVKLTLLHQAFGFRAGMNFELTNRFSFTVGGQYRPGSLKPEKNPFSSARSFNQLSVFLTFSYALISRGLFQED